MIKWLKDLWSWYLDQLKNPQPLTDEERLDREW